MYLFLRRKRLDLNGLEVARGRVGLTGLVRLQDAGEGDFEAGIPLCGRVGAGDAV